MYVCPFEIVPVITDILFFLVFFLCISFWVVSTAVSSNLLVFSSTISNLWLISFHIFFSSQTLWFLSLENWFGWFVYLPCFHLTNSSGFLNIWNTVMVIAFMSLSTDTVICVISVPVLIDFAPHYLLYLHASSHVDNFLWVPVFWTSICEVLGFFLYSYKYFWTLFCEVKLLENSLSLSGLA